MESISDGWTFEAGILTTGKAKAGKCRDAANRECPEEWKTGQSPVQTEPDNGEGRLNDQGNRFGSDEVVGSTASRTRFGRAVAPCRRKAIPGEKSWLVTGELQRERFPDNPKLQFCARLDLLLPLLLLFRPALANEFAEFAWIFALKSLGDCFGERCVLRILHHHAGPSDRLQECPMEAERKRQRYHGQPSG